MNNIPAFNFELFYPKYLLAYLSDFLPREFIRRFKHPYKFTQDDTIDKTGLLTIDNTLDVRRSGLRLSPVILHNIPDEDIGVEALHGFLLFLPNLIVIALFICLTDTFFIPGL